MNQRPVQSVEEKLSTMSVTAPPIIARGIVQVTAIFENGASSETWPNWNIIMGSAKVRAARVKTSASRIANVCGTK